MIYRIFRTSGKSVKNDIEGLNYSTSIFEDPCENFDSEKERVLYYVNISSIEEIEKLRSNCGSIIIEDHYFWETDSKELSIEIYDDYRE